MKIIPQYITMCTLVDPAKCDYKRLRLDLLSKNSVNFSNFMCDGNKNERKGCPYTQSVKLQEFDGEPLDRRIIFICMLQDPATCDGERCDMSPGAPNISLCDARDKISDRCRYRKTREIIISSEGEEK